MLYNPDNINKKENKITYKTPRPKEADAPNNSEIKFKLGGKPKLSDTDKNKAIARGIIHEDNPDTYIVDRVPAISETVPINRNKIGLTTPWLNKRHLAEISAFIDPSNINIKNKPICIIEENAITAL